ncbi:MAG TPA: SpoIVB peptidase S55 domain-containing protein, partial [Pyrinomonadaceae bacterium]|nr:SpoIVB peptidase S55 domain-containing protein [Pyrinomonadaceae bacterium]
MPRFTRFVAGALLIVALSSVAMAQNAAVIPPKAPELFPLEDLRPGMKGTARTVFSGSETQEFNVEILGVLPGFPGPRQSAIIAKLSGSNVEKTGVFAGMSGSPVYIDGKIVGAIAFSFPFSREPIAGITPIKQMIDLFDKGTENAKPKEPRAVSFAQLAGTDWKPNLP